MATVGLGDRGSSVAPRAQRAVFRGSDDVTNALLPDTGHMLPLERTAPRLQSLLATGWSAAASSAGR